MVTRYTDMSRRQTGLAVLGTVAWTAVAGSIHSQIAEVRTSGYPLHAARKVPASITDHALAAGFSRAFEVSALVALLGLIITILIIRVRREDLAAPTGHHQIEPGPAG